jgi:uncharacterized protein involved in exopolysaccharide biosynthesis
MSNNITDQTPFNVSDSIAEDELTLKYIVKKILTGKKLFVKHFKTIAVFSVFGGILGFGYAFLSKPLYTAKLSFVMRSDATTSAASGLAGLSSLLGSGTSAASTSPLDRIIELIGSDQMVGKALLAEGSIDGKRDLMINHFIRIADLTTSWRKDTTLATLKFNIGDEYGKLNFAQRKAIKGISAMLSGPKGMLSKSFDKKSGIIQMSFVYSHEELSIQLNKAIYNELVHFYTNESIAPLASKVAILQTKVDSIQGVLNYTQNMSALKNDQGLGLLLQQDKVIQKRLDIKETMLTMTYGESLKNLEQLKYMLATTSPSFSIIDEAFSPIKPQEKSKLMFGFIGFFIFGVFSFFYLIAKKWFDRMID